MTASKLPTADSWENSTPDYFSLTPLDGRNAHKLKALVPYFSDFALNRQRVFVEIEYLIFLARLKLAPPLNTKAIHYLHHLEKSFDHTAAAAIRQHEHRTHHDVKAVEYYLRDQCRTAGLTAHLPYLHWGLTSEDINNLAYSSLLQSSWRQVMLPLITECLDALAELVAHANIPMLGRTHGQPAALTTLAKELAVYLNRFDTVLKPAAKLTLKGKVTGAVGALTDHMCAAPHIHWPHHLAQFIQSFGLEPMLLTTQILPAETYTSLFDYLYRLNTIAIDLCQNLWSYIGFDYFSLTSKPGEVGSSVMPQKVNPIYFEGAEGGFEIANALFSLYRQKLPRSRLQRDLSDSTVKRSFGIAFGYTYLSWQSLHTALERLSINPPSLKKDLSSHYEILTSTLQTYLRSQGHTQAYETLEDLVKGRSLNQTEWHELLRSQNLDPSLVASLTFTRLAQPIRQLVNLALRQHRQFIKTLKPKEDRQ